LLQQQWTARSNIDFVSAVAVMIANEVDALRAR